MPTYEYKCEKCGYDFEKMQSITSKSLRKCPKCGKSALRRLIGTGAGVIFKGSGFYATDYRSESYKQGAKSETPKTETAKTSEKKETTPAKTEASKTERPKEKGKSKK